MARQLEELMQGAVHRFSDFRTLSDVVPRTGAGIYTIWDDARGLVYVGIAGRNPDGTGLASRLRSHASGRRSGDQFCVYVADHYVMPELSGLKSRRSETAAYPWMGSFANAFMNDSRFASRWLRASLRR